MFTRSERGKTVELDVQLHRRLKMLSVLTGKSLADTTDELIRRQLAAMPELDRVKNQNGALFQMTPGH